MHKRIISALVCVCTAFFVGIPAHAAPQETEKADEIISSMVLIEARPDFSFRFDLTNTTDGEFSPIEKDYYLSAYKVTNKQYAVFVSETSAKTPSYWKNGTYPEGKADHPVLNISYSDAVDYCEWLSDKYDGWTFRLPTEAEWENAAMGKYYDDYSVKYPSGKEAPSYNASTGELTTSFNFNGVIASRLLAEYGVNYPVTYVKGDFAGSSEALGECISVNANGGVTNWANHGGDAIKGYFLQTDLYAKVSANGGYTTAVGTYAPNSLGLYDMAGNAWDLTSSIIVAENGLEKGGSCYAVRGGSWYATARSCTFYYRGEGRKDSPSSTVGFRLAADYSPNDSALETTGVNGNIILTIGNKESLVFGKAVTNDVAPIIRSNRTMLPARFVAEHLGANVVWSAKEPQKVLITKGNIEIILYIGSDTAYVNGVKHTLDCPVFIENDRTYTPVRFICEGLGADVDWNGEKSEIIITPKHD